MSFARREVDCRRSRFGGARSCNVPVCEQQYKLVTKARMYSGRSHTTILHRMSVGYVLSDVRQAVCSSRATMESFRSNFDLKEQIGNRTCGVLTSVCVCVCGHFSIREIAIAAVSSRERRANFSSYPPRRCSLCRDEESREWRTTRFAIDAQVVFPNR